MRRMVSAAIVAALAACGGGGGGGAGGAGGAKAPAVAASTEVAQLDGLVVWETRLADAPPGVQDRVQMVQLLIDTFAKVPRPAKPYAEDAAAWQSAMESNQALFADYQRAVVAYTGTRADVDQAKAALSDERARLYLTTIALIEASQSARYLTDAGIGAPSLVSCHRTPDEEYGLALQRMQALAESCVELAAVAGGPLATNGAECQRRIDWTAAQLATGVTPPCTAAN